MSRFIVTITPPTPNGDLHIGHFAGPFLAADVFTRLQRQQGHECMLVCYMDDYHSYMLRKGLELDRDPDDIARENAGKINATLAGARIEVDNFLSAGGNPYYRRAATEIYEAASNAGAITRRTSKEPYCPNCGTWGYEAFGRGLCNYCGQDSDASQCEECAYPPDPAKMKDYHCKLCGGEFEWRPVERDFLDIQRYGDFLKGVFKRAPIRPPVDRWASEILTNGPKEWGITRPGEAGLDLTEDGSTRLHTWFLGLAGYMAATREYAEEVAGRPELYDEYWHSPGVTLAQFLGYDCAYSHLVAYPALLSNFEEPRPVHHFYPNQFLKLNGKNLSTSRNHVLWVRDLVEAFGADAVRLYLAAIAPEETVGDFQEAGFKEWHRSVFTKTIPALLDRAVQEQGAGEPAAVDPDDESLIRNFQDRWRAAASIDDFSMRTLAHIMLDAIAVAAERLRFDKPVAPFVRLIGDLGPPLIPDLSQQISETLSRGAGAPRDERSKVSSLSDAV